MSQPAAIYARVSPDRQKENHTIASQTAALIEKAQIPGTACRRGGYAVQSALRLSGREEE